MIQRAWLPALTGDIIRFLRSQGVPEEVVITACEAFLKQLLIDGVPADVLRAALDAAGAKVQ